MTRSHRYIGIDLLRFLAALLVVFFHMAVWSWVAPTDTTAQVVRGAVAFPELQSVAAPGWVGVQIFFVISGFVIAFSAHGATPGLFLRRRFLRLFPGAVAATAISAAVLVFERIDTLPALEQRVFNSVMFSPFGPWIDGVYWTLGIEISFYALVLALLLARRESWLEPVIRVVGLVSTAFAAARVIVPATASLPYDRGAELLLLKHGMFFCLGATLWAAVARGWSPARAAVAAICVVGGILEIATVSLGPPAASAAIALWLVAMVLLGLSIAFDDVAGRIAGRAAPVIVTIGLATYPLYLVHNVPGAAVLRYLVLSGTPRFVALALAMVVAVLLAFLVTLYPERWLRRFVVFVLARFDTAHGEKEAV